MAAALLATASLVALLAGMPKAAAEDCAGAAGAPPSNIATPSMLYDTLRARTNAQLLAIGFMRKPVEEACAWIYEVKLLTASGSVVELDFAADGLGLVGARGPDDDRDAAALVKNFGGDAAVLRARTGVGETGSKASGTASNSGKGSGGGDGDDHGGDDHGGDDGGGEGGNSGSGSGGGDDGGGDGGDGGGEGGDGGDGGGDGGDHDGGGEGGDD